MTTLYTSGSALIISSVVQSGSARVKSIRALGLQLGGRYVLDTVVRHERGERQSFERAHFLKLLS